MFCPRCGQQQHSDELRFCPRCGLPLAGVTALLAADGVTPTGEELVRANQTTARRAGIRRGAKLMFFSAVLFPVFLGLSFIFDSPIPLFAPITLFLAGLAWLLYFVLFGEDTPVAQGHGKGTKRFGRRATPLLGAPQCAPVPGPHTERVRTTELSQPASVTEQTTTLLDQDRPSSSPRQGMAHRD